MKLLDLLQQLGLTEREAKSRFANKLIKINGELCTAIDHNIQLASEEKIGYTPLDDFLFDLYFDTVKEDKEFSDLVLKYRISSEPLPALFNMPKRDKMCAFLSGFTCISIDRREDYVFLK